jgi:DNA topoisomerase-1
MKSLIIVESFTKTKTIKKYLGDRDVSVAFSGGHIYNLPKDTLGFNTDTWDITYVPTNPNIIKNIKEMARNADVIYLAADPDLEGEAIAHSLYKCLEGIIKDGSSGSGKVCHRITFNEITKNAVINALENPRTIDMDKVKAQETRRIVDRLIGYKVSPVLWNKFNKNYLSAGRVQIAGLIICINQRTRIINKEIIPYWTIEGTFSIGKDLAITGTLYAASAANASADANAKLIEYKIRDIEIVKNILNDLSIGAKYNIEYAKHIRNVSPSPPYTTTTLQQDAYNKCRFNAKETMKLAQDLYEHGYITYMRTDSTSIAEDAKKMILSYIRDTYDGSSGASFAKYRTFKTKVANAQEAHEAVRITNPKNKTISFEGSTKKHEKLYELIWVRTLASLMTDAVYTDLQLKFCDRHIFCATKSYLKELGFRILYEDKLENENLEDFVKIIKDNKQQATAKEYSSQGTIDNIPSLYNEVQLIKELEKEGIGRPSTYSSIIDKLLDKKYVEIGTNPQQEYEIECFKKKKSKERSGGESGELIITTKKINLGGKQKDLLVPTELGLEIIKYIYEIFPYLCDLKFTSKMEDDLDKIINASSNVGITKVAVLNDIFAKIKGSIASIEPTSGVSGSTGSGSISKEKKTGIITTRYGVCYYNKELDKYTNIEPFLKWKKISKEGLKERDIAFLSSLPKPIEYLGKKYDLHLGKFGIYLKDNKNNNHKLDKKLWDTFCFG